MSKLERALALDDEDARRRAIECVAARPTDLIARVAKLLGRERVSVRSGAAELLERLGRELSATEEVLCERTRDADERVRECAVAALRYVGGQSSVPALVASLHDPSPYVRLAGAFALGRIGGAQAVPSLVSAVRDEDHEVADNAIGSLIEIGPPALRYLVDMLDADEASRRQHAREILKDFTDPLAERGLNAYLEDPDATVRLLAVRAVAGTGGHGLLPELVRLVHDDPDPDVRVAAVTALGDLGGDEARMALEAAASADADDGVRVAARAALESRSAT